MHGHWSRTCRTLKYFTDLYQTYLKQNVVEINFIHKNDFEGHNIYLNVNVYLDVFDLFGNPDKTNNILSGEILGMIDIFICIMIFILLYF
jgi:hypothetical protein